ncbi:MAG: hypothetical protein PHD74_04990 [Candidatus Krumholzibacteria bacterium]|nr:hypothetical protein [Candidatus Krumholzibacteria bacterium]
MRFRSASWLLLSVALVTFGCTGDTGPAGPRGATGSANVIYSDWYSPSTWDAESEFGVAQRTYTMTTTSLTQEIIDRGVVLVYMRFIGFNPEIVQLPFLVNNPAYSFSFRASAGSIKVVYYDTAAPTTTPIIIPSENQIRYVLIPGGALDASMQADGSTCEQEIANLKSMSYSEVCRKYSVPE